MLRDRVSRAPRTIKGWLGGRLRRLQVPIARALFDRGGTDTIEPVSSDELGHDENMVLYKASGRFYLRRAIRARDVGPEDVFIDLGSGKGRVVLLAARYPFGRVIGVEISEELNDIARENVERVRDKLRCPRVEIVTADLTQYKLPDEVTHAYMYNPVTGPLFEAVLSNVLASLDRRPRPLRLIYACPDAPLRAALEKTGRFRLVKQSRGMRLDLPPYVFVYEALTGLPADRASSSTGTDDGIKIGA
jgi:SAM-dependent methyltransferase